MVRHFRVLSFVLVGFLVMFLVTSLSVAANEVPQNQKHKLSVGLGLGIPYGVLGFNLEYTPNLFKSESSNIPSYFSLSLGVGISPGGIAYAVGIRAYPMGRETKWQPRVSGYYGIVALLQYGYSSDYDRLDGFAFGGGCLYRINKKISVDFDLLYIFPDYDYGTLEGGRLKISVGSHWHLK